MFDVVTSDDLIIAFYPCIYFCEKSQSSFALSCINYRALGTEQKIVKVLERSSIRNEYYERLIKFVAVALRKNLRLVFENPYTQPHYLKNNFLKNPDVVDGNRMMRGDYFRKPTAYWFFNCEPTHGFFTVQNDKEQKIIAKTKSSKEAGLCSEERSMISSDYARNFIKDFILGTGVSVYTGELFPEGMFG